VRDSADETAELGVWLCGGSQLPGPLMSAICGRSPWVESGGNEHSDRGDAAGAGTGAGRLSSVGPLGALGSFDAAEVGFHQGGVLDGLEPCPELAIFLQETAAVCPWAEVPGDVRHDIRDDVLDDAPDIGRSGGRCGAGDGAPDGICGGVGTGAGMQRLGDEALTGVLRGWRRLGSWAAAMEHAAAAELADRRIAAAKSAGCWANEAERYASAEIAAALTLTRSAADGLVARALVLRGLAGTAAALAAGLIDMPRALVITTGVAGLADEQARAVEADVLDKAPLQTTAELRRAVSRAAMAADPTAADERREQAEKRARVERWAEPYGTGAIAGRDLPPADVLAAENRINALAAALKSDGAVGGMDLLRAQVFLDLLLGRPAAAPAFGDVPKPSGKRMCEPIPAPSAEPAVGPETAPTEHDVAGSVPHGPVPAPAPAPARDTARARDTAPALTSPQDLPAGLRRRVPSGDSCPGCTGQSGWTGMTGSVNLTVPLATLLGLTDSPGDVAGFGPVTASTARDLAAVAAAGPATRWCVTVLGEHGQAIAHGCATRRQGWPRGPDPDGRDGRGRDGPDYARQMTHGHEHERRRRGEPGREASRAPAPGQEGYPQDRGQPGGLAPDSQGTGRRALAGWSLTLALSAIATANCSHERETSAYRLSSPLRHLIQVRNTTCTFPGCRRPSCGCDMDHTIPFDEGGISCECNIAPLCRFHHKLKHADGWELTQPIPGTLIWTAPSGWKYPVGPDAHPG
jgi:hypothetical protein